MTKQSSSVSSSELYILSLVHIFVTLYVQPSYRVDVYIVDPRAQTYRRTCSAKISANMNDANVESDQYPICACNEFRIGTRYLTRMSSQ